MSSLSGILNIGKTSLFAHQKAINIAGNNIANVNTPGYSRQKVNMEQCAPVRYSGGQLNRGVKADEKVQRIYDRFLGAQINNENQNLGRWEAQKGVLEKVEIAFDEVAGYGLSYAMSEFWNGWQDLANNPSGHTERVTLLTKSEVMTGTFNKMYSDLEQIQKDVDTSIQGTVEDINRIAEQIAELNNKIIKSEVGGYSANDLRDTRDLALKELSGMIDFTSFEDDIGNVAVLVGGGKPLVENVSSWELSTNTNGSGHQDIFWVNSNGTSENITANISGGKLKGWLTTRDDIVPDYLDRLDTLAGNIISEVNTIHASGYALDSSQNNFFTGSSAYDIGVNQDIVDDVNLIAAAGSSDDVPGGNSNAVDIATLQNALKMSGLTATYDDYYNSLVSDVGSGVYDATINYDHQSTMVTHLDNYRETISGVSLDEEMVNLVKFQHAYDAAAKLISTVDELLASVINMV